jgi:hypothetical protein
MTSSQQALEPTRTLHVVRSKYCYQDILAIAQYIIADKDKEAKLSISSPMNTSIQNSERKSEIRHIGNGGGWLDMIYYGSVEVLIIRVFEAFNPKVLFTMIYKKSAPLVLLNIIIVMQFELDLDHLQPSLWFFRLKLARW